MLLTNKRNGSIIQTIFLKGAAAMIIRNTAVMNMDMVMYGMYNGFGLLCL